MTAAAPLSTTLPALKRLTAHLIGERFIFGENFSSLLLARCLAAHGHHVKPTSGYVLEELFSHGSPSQQSHRLAHKVYASIWLQGADKSEHIDISDPKYIIQTALAADIQGPGPINADKAFDAFYPEDAAATDPCGHLKEKADFIEKYCLTLDYTPLLLGSFQLLSTALVTKSLSERANAQGLFKLSPDLPLYKAEGSAVTLYYKKTHLPLPAEVCEQEGTVQQHAAFLNDRFKITINDEIMQEALERQTIALSAKMYLRFLPPLLNQRIHLPMQHIFAESLSKP